MCLNGNGRKRPCQDCSEGTLGCGDFFSRKVDFTMPSGRSSYQTWAGCCVSVLMVFFTLFFFWHEMNHLINDNNFAVQQATKRNWY